MTARRYAQYCSIARALDAVGDRWSLLIVRELLEGPRRYTDLMDGLPGIATDMLAARLRDLEHAGVIVRATLPPPAASKVYDLTEFGQELEPVIMTLTQWGIQLLGKREPADSFQARWLVHPLRAMFRPEQTDGLSLTVQFLVDGEALGVTVDNGEVAFVEAKLDSPDVVITATAQTLAEAWVDPSRTAKLAASGRLKTFGAPQAVSQFRVAFGLARAR